MCEIVSFQFFEPNNPLILEFTGPLSIPVAVLRHFLFLLLRVPKVLLLTEVMADILPMRLFCCFMAVVLPMSLLLVFLVALRRLACR